ncbi:hypothetical protein GCM10008164_22060 [Achromobacter xylosoxidans]|nr:hypothetical protein GCM10008164_22060 [Achromobacter xylosoxidans]
MRTICFVTYELYPVTRGGCGALLYNVACQLLQAGHRVVFLLDVDRPTFERFDLEERLRLPHADNCVAYQLSAVLPEATLLREDFSSWYEWRSYLLSLGAQHVHRAERPDLIEFFDYHGVAYYSLCEKIALGRFEGSHIAVRFHATIEAMDRVDLTNFLSPELWTLYSLERGALDLAETVIAPSHSFYERSLSNLYPGSRGRERIAVPPLRKALARHQSPKPDQQAVLCYGRLFSIKGVDLMVDAAVQWMQQRPEIKPKFYFVGGDSMQPPDGSGEYAEYLKRRIPVELKQYFHFTGHMTHEAMEELLADVRFAVFANRYESFCYAAHELYAAHVPLIVSAIPGFADFFEHEKNALVFDESRADSLVQAMERLWHDDDLRAKLAFPYPVIPSNVAPVYEDEHLESWMDVARRKAGTAQLRITTMIVANSLSDAKQTARPLRGVGGHLCLVLLPAESYPDEISAYLLGRNVVCVNLDGEVQDLHSLRATEAMLILRCGDSIDAQYLTTAARTLSQFTAVPFVTCWQHRLTSAAGSVDTYALSLALDVAPMSGRSPFTRAVFRTSPDRLILDSFDTNLGEYAEIGFLWNLTAAAEPGVVIPEAWIKPKAESYAPPTPKQLSYLLNRDSSEVRRTRLAQFAVANWNIVPNVIERQEMAAEMRALPPELAHLLLRVGHKIVRLYTRFGLARTIIKWVRRRIRGVSMGMPKIR